MDSRVKAAIVAAVKNEPFARTFDIQLIELDDGRSVVEMTFVPEMANNIYARAHGGAIYGLIDEAFEARTPEAGGPARGGADSPVAGTERAGTPAGCHVPGAERGLRAPTRS